MEMIQRKEELAWLSTMQKNSEKKLYPVVITGSRRVGKTTLISEFIRGKPAFYIFVNDSKPRALLLQECIEQIRIKDKYFSCQSWDELFEYLLEKSPFEIIVFDEFQNFSVADKSVFGVLQTLIDKHEYNSKKLLVFLGSIMGLMNEIFYDSSSPLFGRVKATLKVKPLTFWQTFRALKKIGFGTDEERIKYYFIFGGYPKYLSFVDDYVQDAKDIDSLLSILLFSSNSVLEDEIKSILLTEFGSRGAQQYGILEAIATGHTKLSEISSYVKLQATSLSQFISHLIEYYDFIERKISILAPKMKDSRYAIKNSLFRFWFRFILPNSTYLEVGNYSTLKEKILSGLNGFMGKEFEVLCKEFIVRFATELELKEIGAWWHKDREIDLISIGKETIVWECKWSKIDEKDALRISIRLEENAMAAGITKFKKGLFAKDVSKGVLGHFDYVVTLGDIIEEKLPHSK